MSAPSNSAPQTEREAAGRTGAFPGKVHVLRGAAAAADDGTVPIGAGRAPVSPPGAPPSGTDVARVALGAGACAVVVGAVAIGASHGPVVALCLAAAFALPVAFEAWAWWRGRARSCRDGS